MKAIFISYNQTLTERVMFIFEKHNIKGYTKWGTVQGSGSNGGVPHLGSHAWPELNAAIITVVEDDKAEALLLSLRKLNEKNTEQGLRAFVWTAESGV